MIYVHPLGECCGKWFWTWEGWAAHKRRHARVIPPLPEDAK